MFGFGDAVAVAAFGEEVHFGGDVEAFEGEVVEDGGLAGDAVVFGVDEEGGGDVFGEGEVGGEFSGGVVSADEVGGVDEAGEVGSRGLLVGVVDGFVGAGGECGGGDGGEVAAGGEAHEANFFAGDFFLWRRGGGRGRWRVGRLGGRGRGGLGLGLFSAGGI